MGLESAIERLRWELWRQDDNGVRVLIACFEQPSAGNIFIGDSLVSSRETGLHLPPEARRIGVVFQDYAVWPHKTVFDNVIYPLSIQKIPKDEARRRTIAAIESVNLRGLEDRMPYQLSGGQQQRVALARALVSNPEIMLLDEPLCNLDANLREEMRFEIKDLQRKFGFSIIYVTHDQAEAMALSDRIMVMSEGTMQQVDTPLNIYNRPANRFVFSFIGLSNFIPALVADGVAYVAELPGAGPLTRQIPEHVREGGVTLACRPSEIDFVPEGGVPGIVKRKAFLGELIDYRVQVGNVEVRVQKLRRNGLLKEGERCSLKFHRLLCYEPDDFTGHLPEFGQP